MYLWLRLDVVVLNPLLLGCFAHCSRRNTATDDLFFVVITMDVVTRHRYFSGLALCSNAFEVRYWCFLDPLFTRYSLLSLA